MSKEEAKAFIEKCEARLDYQFYRAMYLTVEKVKRMLEERDGL